MSIVGLFAVITTAAWIAVIRSSTLPESVTDLASNLGQGAVSLAAGLAGVLRSLRRAPIQVRRFWRYVGLACLSWTSGQVVWSVYEQILHTEVPPLSLADLGYLLFVPLLITALLCSPLAVADSARQIRGVLDGMLVASSALLVSWILVLRAVLDAGSESALTMVVALAYPIGDAVIITIVLYIGLGEHGLLSSFRAPYFLTGAGLVAITVADSAYIYQATVGSYATGGFVDAWWFVGFLIIMVAAFLPDEPDNATPRHARSTSPLTTLLLPYIAIGIALLSSGLDLIATGHSDLVVFWLRTAVVCLLVARQIATLLENRALTRGLEARVQDRTAELRTSRERFAALVAHSSDVTMVLDREGTITYLSDASNRVLGLAPNELIGAHISAAIGTTAETAAFLGALRHTAEEPLRVHTGSSTWSSGGTARNLELTLTNLLDNPDVSGIVLNIHNVTDRKELENQLVHQAFHDALTGMSNRAHFRDRLERAFADRDSAAAGVTVLFMDLDGFKTINDTLGHGAGDAVLREVAQRIIAVVGESAVVARIGGDEFGILVEGSPDHCFLADLAGRITAALNEPFRLDGREMHLGGSIGIANLTADVDSAEQLLRNADLAMYEAKTARTGGYAFFEPAMHDGLVERVRLEEDLRAALDADGFEVHYQPLFALDSQRVTGVEALLRWNHPTRGLVSPVEFIPAAESTGLIRPLGLWVLESACRQGRAWQGIAPDQDGLKISVNLSARQLDQPDLVDRIAAILEQTGLPPCRLVLEMTEGVLMENTDSTLQILNQIRNLGIRLAIDDFGTGYSSLSYLHQFPVDILKIDRSFVQDLAAGRDTALVRSIVQLAQSLGLETVAEGIEREQELDLLRLLGCTTGQGYYFSRPVPAATLSQILLRQRLERVLVPS
ncbi:bifunctional diguanylate cyclase/phosphodiesterase [Skermania piniformis]